VTRPLGHCLILIFRGCHLSGRPHALGHGYQINVSVVFSGLPIGHAKGIEQVLAIGTQSGASDLAHSHHVQECHGALLLTERGRRCRRRTNNRKNCEYQQIQSPGFHTLYLPFSRSMWPLGVKLVQSRVASSPKRGCVRKISSETDQLTRDVTILVAKLQTEKV